MREVSCRAFDLWFPALKAKKIPAERLVDGTSLRLSTLRSKHERVDWADFVKVLRNAGCFFSDEELVALGSALFRTPGARFAAVVAPLFFSVNDFYRWVNQRKSGGGNQLFTCIAPIHRDVSERRIEVELVLSPELEMCREFFVITKGNFIEMPRLFGLAPAQVEMIWLPHGARYVIDVPEAKGLRPRIRRALRWPLNVREAAAEVKAAHEALQQRYEQLSDARDQLERQARELRTAHAVSHAAHESVDLERVLEAISRALVEQAGFAGASIAVSIELDGVKIERSARAGGDGPTEIVRSLVGHGAARMGELRAWAKPGDSSKDQLLEFVLPTVSMALENAISFAVVEELRDSLEERVVSRTAELTQARDALAETVARLEEAKALRDRIFANLNHEIRTPLSLILLSISRVRDAAGLPAEVLRQLDVMVAAARRLLRLVDELLLLAEGREGDIRLKPVRCDLSDLAARIVEGWTIPARSGDFDLALDAPRPCFALVDPTAIERAVSNLLSNAMKYTPARGHITVSVGAEGGRTRVGVKDDGPGIEDELRARLFGRFERGERAIASGVMGSGLGLSLVKELTEAQGGDVELESAPGAGTLVRLSFPEAPEAAAEPPPETRTKLSPQDFGVRVVVPDARSVYEPSQPAKATILLAEDDPELRHEIARVLSVEYRIITAKDGLEALRLAEVHRPDLLVTDVAMPGIDGLELTRRFFAQRAESARVAPVLLLSAYGEIRARLAGFEAGAVDYLVKPFEPAELRARIRSQLALRAVTVRLVETEQLAAIGRLSAGLAHEIRNPANGIVNAIEPLREALPPECVAGGTAAGQLLDVIASCSRQVALLSRQLLGFRRAAELARGPVEVDTLVKRASAALPSPASAVELRRRFEYHGPISCCEPLMQQVFSNLLDNAAYAAGRGGWVEVRTALEAGRVVVEFRDSGPGVAAEHRQRLFEPFFTTKPPGAGTGLGLATAREIVTRHGGILDLRADDRSTLFRLELPTEETA